MTSARSLGARLFALMRLDCRCNVRLVLAPCALNAAPSQYVPSAFLLPEDLEIYEATLAGGVSIDVGLLQDLGLEQDLRDAGSQNKRRTLGNRFGKWHGATERRPLFVLGGIPFSERPTCLSAQDVGFMLDFARRRGLGNLVETHVFGSGCLPLDS